MLIIPAIDLKDGCCVRLRQGDLNQETVYSQDPPAMALHWERQGARFLHIVDLNGAVDGRPRNVVQIEAILKTVSIPVQIGGGIRTLEAIRLYLSRGAARVVLGTAVLQNWALLEQACAEFPGQVLISVDVRDGKVAVQGWTSLSQTLAFDVVRRLDGYPLAGLVFTDISRDGMLEGPNLVTLRQIVDCTAIPVIASGGITCLEDIRAIKSLGARVEGIIVGKALYDGKLDLRAATEAAETTC